MTYATFLESKQTRRAFDGREASPDLVHPLLHDWQARVTTWAVRHGRAAIFADCGLGKTFMQLEWLRLLDVKRGLICAPLSVARQTEAEAARLPV